LTITNGHKQSFPDRAKAKDICIKSMK